MKKYFFIVGVVLTLNCYSQWQQTNGPNCGSIYCFANKGNDIFAGTSGGIFFSQDNGNNWNAVNNGLTEHEIFCIVINKNKIIAGSINGQIFYSDNYGQNWKRSNFNIEWKSKQIYCLQYNGNIFMAGTNHGLFVSVDGVEWSLLNKYTSFDVSSICSKDSIILIGTQYNGIYYSKDIGKTWQSSDSIGTKIKTNSIIYFNNKFYTASDGNIFVSDDNGSHWVKHDSISPQNRSIRLFASNSTMFANVNLQGVYCSKDGNNWKNILSDDYDKQIYCLGFNHDKILLGTYNGAFRLDTLSKTCEEINNGLIASEIRCIAANDSLIYATTGNGMLFCSTDGGINWKKIHFFSNTSIISIAILDSNIFIGTNGKGILLSSDCGLTWKIINSGLDKLIVEGIEICNNKVYASAFGLYEYNWNNSSWKKVNVDLEYKYTTRTTKYNENIYFAARDNILYSNCGSKWKYLSNKIDIYSLENIHIVNDSIYVITGGCNGVNLSKDYGKTWKNVYYKGYINRQLILQGCIHSFASNDYHIFAGTGEGVIMSNDIFGNKWDLLDKNNSFPNYYFNKYKINSLLTFRSNLIAGTAGGGIWIHPLPVK